MELRPRQIRQIEMGHLGQYFILVGKLMGCDLAYKGVVDFDRDEYGLIQIIPPESSPSLSPLEILDEIHKKRLRTGRPEISRRNAGLAAIIGGFALKGIRDIANAQKYPFSDGALSAISRRSRHLNENITDVVVGLDLKRDSNTPPRIAYRMNKINNLLYEAGSQPKITVRNSIIERS